MVYSLVKKIFLYFIFLVFFIGGCTKSCSKSSYENTLVIGTNANLPPFESVNEKGELEGFDIEFGHKLAQTLNKRAVFKEFDFDALVLALQKGQIDIILSGLSITKARQKEITMLPYQGKPITHAALLFWAQKPNFTTFAELKNFAIEKNLAVTVQAGHFLEDFLKSQNIPLKPLLGPPEQLLDIKYKKSLAAALDPANAEKLASKHHDLFLLKIALPEEQWDLGNGIGINKKNEKLTQEIKNALETLRSNGTIEALEQKWLKIEGEN